MNGYLFVASVVPVAFGVLTVMTVVPSVSSICNGSDYSTGFGMYYGNAT